jgi:hypothetical protein
VLVPWPDKAGTLTVTQEGSGKPWLTVQSLAAIPLQAPLRAGYGVTRSVTAVEQKDKSRWSRGDVLRVRLEVDAQADMTWVVLADPVPGGATILGSGLGRDSADRHARRTQGRQRLAGLRGAQLRGLPQLLRVPAARQACGGVHRAAEQPGPLLAAAHARGGDVRARVLRRAPNAPLEVAP